MDKQLIERIAELEQNGRVNTGDGTGGTVPRFGFDCTVSPPEIMPATNGAYVHYSSYLELFKQLTASNELIEKCEKAQVRALAKLAAYVGVCNGDKELTGLVLPLLRESLAAIAAHRKAAE